MHLSFIRLQTMVQQPTAVPAIDFGDFEDLYETVTGVFHVTLAGPDIVVLSGALVLESVHKRWLEAIIEHFHDSYLQWPTGAVYQPLRDQLKRLRGTKILLLAVCAHLHIKYDLPRALAECTEASLSTEGLDARRLRQECRLIFLGFAPRFREALKAAKLPCLLRVALLFRMHWIFEHWVIARRNQAWIHAELLMDAVPADRHRYGQQLMAEFRADLDRAMARFWSVIAAAQIGMSSGAVAGGAIIALILLPPETWRSGRFTGKTDNLIASTCISGPRGYDGQCADLFRAWDAAPPWTSVYRVELLIAPAIVCIVAWIVWMLLVRRALREFWLR